MAAMLLMSAHATAVTWTASEKVTLIHFWVGHNGVFVKQAQMISYPSCPRDDQYFLEKNHPFFDQVYALLMAAQVSGQPIQFQVDGCADGFPRILHVYSPAG